MTTQVKTEYTVREGDKLNVTEAARIGGMTPQRFRRALMRLAIPVERSGRIVLVNRSAIHVVKDAFRKGVIVPGRPKKEA